MIEFRLINDNDLPIIERWLNTAHVKRWYEIPSLGISIEDWMSEIKEYKGAFNWITYMLVLHDSNSIGMCLYYKCIDSEGENFGNLPLEGSYGIDYLIGETSYLGIGLGKEMVNGLVKHIFSLPDTKRVTADIDSSNLASKSTLLSCGFKSLENSKTRFIYTCS